MRKVRGWNAQKSMTWSQSPPTKSLRSTSTLMIPSWYLRLVPIRPSRVTHARAHTIGCDHQVRQEVASIRELQSAVRACSTASEHVSISIPSRCADARMPRKGRRRHSQKSIAVGAIHFLKSDAGAISPRLIRWSLMRAGNNGIICADRV